MNHRDHIHAIQAKRIQEYLDDDDASHIAELLEAAQKQEREQQQVVQDTAKETQ